DYAFPRVDEGFVLSVLYTLITPFIIGLAIDGPEFLVWYVIDACRHLSGLETRFRPPTRVPTVPPPTPFATPVPPPFAVSPTLSPSPPAGSWSTGVPAASSGHGLCALWTLLSDALNTSKPQQ